MRVPAKLAAAWAAKLRASGFEDLETAGGMLSDRGNPTFARGAGHGAFGVDQRHHQRTPMQLAEEETYYDNAREAARTHRFRSVTDRRAWEMHADGFGLRAIGAELGLNFRQARETVLRVSEEIRITATESKLINQSNQTRRRKVDRWVKTADVETLLLLAAVLP